jgi:hypothetical protein
MTWIDRQIAVRLLGFSFSSHRRSNLTYHDAADSELRWPASL